MRTQIVAFLISVGIAALLTPLVLLLARRFGLYDSPDGRRKIHTGQIPRLGGVAIACGFAAPLVGLLVYTNKYSEHLKGDELRLGVFFGGLLMVVALGMLDDLKGCGAWPKLAVQCLIGALLWYGGVSFEYLSFFGVVVKFGILSLPITMIWVAAIINAMNLIDGLDGLAGGVAFFAATSLFVIAWMDGNPVLALFASALAGSVLGFLLYNFAPAMIFMGDTGSMTIGYIFAAAALWSVGKRSTAMALALPMIALGVPLFDTVFAFARRALKGHSPFQSDRGHIHHRLIDAGYSHRQAVLLLYGVCVGLTLLAIIIRSTDDPVYGVVLLGLMVLIYFALRAYRRFNRSMRLAQQAAAEQDGGPQRAPGVSARGDGGDAPPDSTPEPAPSDPQARG